MDEFGEKTGAYDSESLREFLFTAIRQGDAEKFVYLCSKNASLIIQYFDEWRKIPSNLRKDPEAVEIWGHCLISIANAFNSIGHPELNASLTGDDNNNPITRWSRQFGKAQYLSESGQHQESNYVLLEILTEMGVCIGTGIDDFRPKIYGLIGMNFFRINDFENAKKYTELALFDCERTGDMEGVIIYTENLKILGSRNSYSIAQCRRKVAKAQELSDHLQYVYSNKILQEALIDIERNSELRCYRSKVYGLIGSNNFKLGYMQYARQYTELALNDCEADGDNKGIRIYKENIRIISEKTDGRITK